MRKMLINGLLGIAVCGILLSLGHVHIVDVHHHNEQHDGHHGETTRQECGICTYAQVGIVGFYDSPCKHYLIIMDELRFLECIKYIENSVSSIWGRGPPFS